MKKAKGKKKWVYGMNLSESELDDISRNYGSKSFDGTYSGYYPNDTDISGVKKKVHKGYKEIKRNKEMW